MIWKNILPPFPRYLIFFPPSGNRSASTCVSPGNYLFHCFQADSADYFFDGKKVTPPHPLFHTFFSLCSRCSLFSPFKSSLNIFAFSIYEKKKLRMCACDDVDRKRQKINVFLFDFFTLVFLFDTPSVIFLYQIHFFILLYRLFFM